METGDEIRKWKRGQRNLEKHQGQAYVFQDRKGRARLMGLRNA